ncbi:hypothetical protein FHS43_005232 [Streptosporangium becharense]|uniref:Uncharacterized protein n=1 Tax=Streptosporangium becharense TaxID=1816182 RepID=A0A7W9IIL8_9ACTN|nr:hypothetical protein [Streptosporangium becharense]MBB2913923.1 hypothetical protein [Streptosporangium becharense]MBB5821415.1 hypothetical protein [Streptosporangium becharense]
MNRALVPASLRRAVLRWFDSRYISRADHRQDLKDAVWEVRTLSREVRALSREVAALRAEVGELRTRAAASASGAGDRGGVTPERTARWDEAHRLARETAVALDQVLQNEVLLWQAVDRAARTGTARFEAEDSGRPGPGGLGGTVERSGAGSPRGSR